MLRTFGRGRAGDAELSWAYERALFGGDSVGRHSGNDDSTCIAAEKYMVDNAGVITIDSDVLIAPHHGADNGGSTCFIQAVSPEYVIFSAGCERRLKNVARGARKT